MKIPFALLLLLISVSYCGTQQETERTFEWQLFLLSTKSNLLREHLACQRWNAASLLLQPRFFSHLDNNLYQKNSKERERRLNSILSHVVKSQQLQEGFTVKRIESLRKGYHWNHGTFHSSLTLCYLISTLKWRLLSLEKSWKLVKFY